jgi:hypothetical protein
MEHMGCGGKAYWTGFDQGMKDMKEKKGTGQYYKYSSNMSDYPAGYNDGLL